MAAMGSMTAEERDRIVVGLERTRDLLVAAVSGLKQNQWGFQPGEGIWSIRECADHILVIERLLFQTVRDLAAGPPDRERSARVRGKDDRMLAALADRSFKARNPFPTRPSGEAYSPASYVAAFHVVRAEVLDYARNTQDGLRDRVARHPMLKDLDGVQWLLLIWAHTDRHLAQIREVQAHPDYPRAQTVVA
jgi:DinB superfamily